LRINVDTHKKHTEDCERFSNQCLCINNYYLKIVFLISKQNVNIDEHRHGVLLMYCKETSNLLSLRESISNENKWRQLLNKLHTLRTMHQIGGHHWRDKNTTLCKQLKSYVKSTQVHSLNEKKQYPLYSLNMLRSFSGDRRVAPFLV